MLAALTSLRDSGRELILVTGRRVDDLPAGIPRGGVVRDSGGGEWGLALSTSDQGGDLNAPNLMFFIQLADGVDDETWFYHLQRGDYSRWFRESINDDTLASFTERVEKMAISGDESRAMIREAIEERYTLPA